MFNLKRNLKKKRDIFNFLLIQKKQIETDYKVKIEYLELRTNNKLRLSKKINNSRLFIAYYLNNVRLIDNL